MLVHVDPTAVVVVVAAFLGADRFEPGAEVERSEAVVAFDIDIGLLFHQQFDDLDMVVSGRVMEGADFLVVQLIHNLLQTPAVGDLGQNDPHGFYVSFPSELSMQITMIRFLPAALAQVNVF